MAKILINSQKMIPNLHMLLLIIFANLQQNWHQEYNLHKKKFKIQTTILDQDFNNHELVSDKMVN